MAAAAETQQHGAIGANLFHRDVAAMLREPKPNRIRISLRSRSGVDVAAVAREFGGGGHRNAAGLTYDGPLEEIEKKLVESLVRCLASS